ncbi:transcriptional regulator [Pseudonocardia sp. CNS-139]|nr:transcriptional regulator [Pseudonocardia sp. CNS-139]
MSTSPSRAAQEAREALGATLRDLRKAAGLTARQLAEQTGQHYTRVSKIENGVQAPTDDDVRKWCRVCSADDQAPDLIATARSVESSYLELRRQSRAGMKRVIGAHTSELYQRTRQFRIYEHNVIPGLFQTAAYTSAMLTFWAGFLNAPHDIDQAVAERMDKQQVIYRSGKRFAVLLEEQALRTWFGTAETQLGQLDRLLALMSMPNMSLGIIPLLTERTAVGSAGFWIFDDSLVALETPTASIEVNRPREIALYARMFDALSGSALFGPSARDLIAAAIEATNRQR